MLYVGYDVMLMKYFVLNTALVLCTVEPNDMTVDLALSAKV